jgi:hypothetical protein
MKLLFQTTLMAAGLALAASTLLADTPKDEVKKERPVTKAQLQARMQTSANNLIQIGLAMHNYHDVFRNLPGAICDKNGKPLLSWRVAILPFIEQDKLYKEFKLDEPWDSAHNKKLLTKMPWLYKSVHNKPAEDETYYRVFVGNHAMFDHKQKTRLAHITDGLSNTIMVVEAGEAVPWTKPDELEYDPKKRLPELGGMFDGDFQALFGDGVVHLFRKGKKESSLRRLIVRDDGEIITEEDMKP